MGKKRTLFNRINSNTQRDVFMGVLSYYCLDWIIMNDSAKLAEVFENILIEIINQADMNKVSLITSYEYDVAVVKNKGRSISVKIDVDPVAGTSYPDPDPEDVASAKIIRKEIELTGYVCYYFCHLFSHMFDVLISMKMGMTVSDKINAVKGLPAGVVSYTNESVVDEYYTLDLPYVRTFNYDSPYITDSERTYLNHLVQDTVKKEFTVMIDDILNECLLLDFDSVEYADAEEFILSVVGESVQYLLRATYDKTMIVGWDLVGAGGEKRNIEIDIPSDCRLYNITLFINRLDNTALLSPLNLSIKGWTVDRQLDKEADDMMADAEEDLRREALNSGNETPEDDWNNYVYSGSLQ